MAQGEAGKLNNYLIFILQNGEVYSRLAEPSSKEVCHVLVLIHYGNLHNYIYPLSDPLPPHPRGHNVVKPFNCKITPLQNKLERFLGLLFARKAISYTN